LLCLSPFICCDRIQPQISTGHEPPLVEQKELKRRKFAEGSWQSFLQNLPLKQGLVIDYRGEAVSPQTKAAAIIDYDIGRQDLQQCADALIRLRAEYLYAQKRYSEVGFHFTSGHYYSWDQYTAGVRPRVKGSKVQFYKTDPRQQDHRSLRAYLDIVYAYAGTISLASELKHANGFEVGTIIITPGSPGHCTIIIDEATNERGEKLYKLAEGYTPAQSIYVLSNPIDSSISPWYKLSQGDIKTASYIFKNFFLRRFE